jgi:hypothetical protein
LSDETNDGSARPSSARSIAAQVVANTSLLIAVLVYMGWAYEAALYGYFHISPLDLNISIIEYMLVSLTLFKPELVIAVVILIFINAARIWSSDRRRPARPADGKPDDEPAPHLLVSDRHGRLIPPAFAEPARVPAEPERDGRRLVIGAGAVMTAAALVLALLASFVQVNTYLLLVLLGAGPLLLTWPTRTDRRGRFPYALAIVLAAVCALWAASLYASNLGMSAAENLTRHLASRTAVTVYTTQPLALYGPGVYIHTLPRGSLYHYRYGGLRLLTVRSGTYYLLPLDWSPHKDLTYIIDSSDQVRVELY